MTAPRQPTLNAAIGGRLSGRPLFEQMLRPLVRLGFAGDGLEVTDAVMVPELTSTADGAHWPPVGGDLATSPDLAVARGDVTLAEAKRRIVERFLRLRQADGSLPEAYRCAV